MRNGRGRREDIQGLRGIAVLLVVLYHAGLHVPGGYTGVDVFFAISGYVITGSLLPQLVSDGHIRFAAFYARRVRRLLPGLAVMLVVVAALGTFASPIDAQRTGALTGIWASVFAANAFLFRVGTGYFDPGASIDPLLHTWTLAVEEQFYLVFPALLALGWLVRRRTGAVLAIAALSVCSFALALVLSGSADDPTAPGRFAFYGSPTRAWEFGAGALACLAGRVRLSGALREAASLGGLALILVAAFAFGGAASVPGPATLLPVGGACLAMALAGRASATVLGVRPLTWAGDLSYSWYLWHWPLIVFARAFWPHAGAWAAFAALLPAWLSYRYVEEPVRRSPLLRGRRALALGGVCIAAPVLASSALVVVGERVQDSAAAAAWNGANANHVDVVRGCDDATPLGARTGARWAGCRWRVPHSKGVVYLLGDSNAGHFAEGFVAGVNRAGYDAVVAAYEGCPFVDLRIGGTKTGTGPCRRFDVGSLAFLLRSRPSLVVIGNRADGFIDVGSKRLAAAGGPFRSSRAAKKALWRAGLTRMLRRLDGAGVPTAVVHPVPWLATLNDHCAVLLVLRRGCSASVSRARVDAERRDAMEVERAAVAAAGVPARTVDFADAFCSATRCSSTHGGVIVYADRDHLSPQGAVLLEPRFVRLVRSAARR